MKNKKVLITGASGFIGSHLTRRLVSEGADVTAVVKYESIIENVRIASVWDDIRVIEADIRNQDSLLPLRGAHFDIVFHLAAYNHVGASFQHVQESIISNALGTSNILESGICFGRFVYTSTSEVYGYQQDCPFEETFEPFPISPYSVGKYAGELYSRMKRHQTGEPIVCIRPFNTFGPYQSDRAVIPELIIKCLRGLPVHTTQGKQTREFNYIDNQVDGFIAAGTSAEAFDEIINIGSNTEIAICDLVQQIHELCDSKSELHIGALADRPTEIWRMSSANDRAKEVLGWEPRISFEVGLKTTIEWYKKFLEVYYDSNSALCNL